MIVSIEKKRGRVLILLDDGTHFNIPHILYEERPLREGQELDPEEYDQWLLLHQYRPALDRAVGYLAERACSRGEIEQRLLRAGYRPATVEMVLYKLQRERLLDDRDFAEQWVRSRSFSKYGRSRIAQELRRKGVSGEDAEAALAGLDEDRERRQAAAEAMKGLKRAKPGEDPRKTAQRVLASLARKGYGYDVARQALESAREQIQEE